MKLDRKLLLISMQKCIENSRELYDEAKILQQNKKFARSYSLYHLCIEEVGKVFLIFMFVLGDNYDEKNVKKFNDDFLKHKVKIDSSKTINQIIYYLSGILRLEDIQKIKYTAEQINQINKFKNLSLYTFFDNDIVFKPSDIIDSEKLIIGIQELAEIRVLGTKQFLEAVLPNIDKLIQVVKENV